MTEQEENIDHFFKENIDKVDVQYNAAHWDKLQKSLIVGAAVGAGTTVAITKWQVILKFLKLYKVFFIGIPTAAIITTSVIYFSKNTPENKVTIPLIKDSIHTTTVYPISPDPDTQLSPIITNPYFVKPHSFKNSDSLSYINPYKIDTTKKLLPSKKDTVISTKKDTTKKKLNVFW